MKNFIKLILFTFVVWAFFITCKKEEIQNFSGQNAIYFELAKMGNLNGSIISKTDSINVSFAFEQQSVKDTLIKIPVKIQGYAFSKARVVNLQVMQTSTAKKDIDFKIPEKIEIPANSVRTYVPVRIYRTAEMKKKELSLNLKLLPNDNFKINLTGQETNPNTNKIVKYDQFKIAINDILSEPYYWGNTRYAYKNMAGPFSVKKLKLLTKLSGAKLSFFRKGPSTKNGTFVIFRYYAKLLKSYLEKKMREGNPVFENDGTMMAVSPFLQ